MIWQARGTGAERRPNVILILLESVGEENSCSDAKMERFSPVVYFP